MSKICGSYKPATGFWKMNKLVRSAPLLYVNGRAALMLNAFHEREFYLKNTLPPRWNYAAEIEFWLYFGVCAKTIHWLSGLWLCYCVCCFAPILTSLCVGATHDARDPSPLFSPSPHLTLSPPRPRLTHRSRAVSLCSPPHSKPRVDIPVPVNWDCALRCSQPTNFVSPVLVSVLTKVSTYEAVAA
jgi:hypothetical protein